jgi:hypothetical protein
MALAPSLLLVGVPSSSSSAWSTRRLVERVHPDDLGAQLGDDVVDGLQHALAEVAALVAVAQLERLVLTRGRARGNGRAAHGAIRQADLHLERGVAPRVQDLSGEASPAGFEPATFRLGSDCSIQLSYGDPSPAYSTPSTASGPADLPRRAALGYGARPWRDT